MNERAPPAHCLKGPPNRLFLAARCALLTPGLVISFPAFFFALFNIQRCVIYSAFFHLLVCSTDPYLPTTQDCEPLFQQRSKSTTIREKSAHKALKDSIGLSFFFLLKCNSFPTRLFFSETPRSTFHRLPERHYYSRFQTRNHSKKIILQQTLFRVPIGGWFGVGEVWGKGDFPRTWSLANRPSRNGVHRLFRGSTLDVVESLCFIAIWWGFLKVFFTHFGHVGIRWVSTFKLQLDYAIFFPKNVSSF